MSTDRGFDDSYALGDDDFWSKYEELWDSQDGTEALQNHPSFAVPFHGIGQRLAFGIPAGGHQILGSERVIHLHGLLGNDRALVEFGIDVVRGSSHGFDPAFVRLVIGLGTLEAGQERVVNVDHPPGHPRGQ